MPASVDPRAWAALACPRPRGWSWLAAGVEAHPGGPPLLALAGVLPDGRALVTVEACPSVERAAARCLAAGVPAVVGASLLRERPVWAGVEVLVGRSTSARAVARMLALAAAGSVAHDGAGPLTVQLLDARVQTGPAGSPRLLTEGPVAAVKAAVWAIRLAAPWASGAAVWRTPARLHASVTAGV